MTRRLTLAAWMGLKPEPKPARRARKPRPEPTSEELQKRDLERAWRCGARYSANRWKQVAPPRMRCDRPGAPQADALRELRKAFHRGYEAATRARYARRRGEMAAWPASPGTDANLSVSP